MLYRHQYGWIFFNNDSTHSSFRTKPVLLNFWHVSITWLIYNTFDFVLFNLRVRSRSTFLVNLASSYRFLIWSHAYLHVLESLTRRYVDVSIIKINFGFPFATIALSLNHLKKISPSRTNTFSSAKYHLS